MAIQRRWRPEDITFEEKPFSYDDYRREQEIKRIQADIIAAFKIEFPATSGGIFQKALLSGTGGYSYCYKTTIVPISEVSSFLDDCQLVIAIYQP